MHVFSFSVLFWELESCNDSSCVSGCVFFPVYSESFCEASALLAKKWYPHTVLGLALLRVKTNYRRKTDWMSEGEAEPCTQNLGSNLEGLGFSSFAIV